ncbi:MAG: DUF2723 domain-containing protein [Anaerolineae bacterium]|nr:DUF2723 domain-containing protein [Anaerolineae bacterium]
MSAAGSKREAGKDMRRGRGLVIHAALFLAAVALYASTLNGDVQPADSGEFQIAAITLGIPHPPGYPLFSMLGWLFAQVPIGSPYARVSFLSVVASATTLVLVSLTVQQALAAWPSVAQSAVHTVAGLAAALALGISTTFWAQATTTNIRSLTALFTALMLYASARAYATGRASTLTLFAGAFGLGVGHHLSLILVGGVLGGYALYAAWRSDGRGLRRAAAPALGILVATQLVWLYLPIRDAAGARFAPGNLTNIDGLLFHIFARGFAGDMLAFAAPEFLFDRLALLPTLLGFQFSAPILISTAIATPPLMWRRRGLGAVWLLACAGHLLITLTYRAPQTVEYAMPCWVILCVVLGAGLGALADMLARMTSRSTILRPAAFMPPLVVVAFAGYDGVQRWPSFLYLSRDRSTRAAAEAVLRSAQPGSVILSQWHQATPLWALQDVEGMRRDVQVEYVFPRGAQPYAETFAEQVARRASTQTTYTTSFFAEEFAARGLRAVPLRDRPAWHVARQFPPPVESEGVLFDERIAVVAPTYLDGRTVEVGQALAVDIGWSLRGDPQFGDSITLRILRPDGRLAANADVRLPPDAQAGDYAVRRIVLGIPLDLSPGAYDIWIGAYRPTEGGFIHYRDADGAEFVPVATIGVTPASLPPATLHSLDEIIRPTASAPHLVGVDYDTGIAGQLRVWTHWRLGRSATEITLADAAGQPLAPPRMLSAATVPGAAQYLSLPFDIPLARGIRIEPFGQRLPDYQPGQRYVPFADQMALIGASAHGGTALKVDLYWLAARPLVNDYIISVRVEGDGLYQTHDGVPALGALPTLKWIRGSRIMDRHPFNLDGERSPLRVGVVVYDSVNRLPLTPLDERYENVVHVMSK